MKLILHSDLPPYYADVPKAFITYGRLMKNEDEAHAVYLLVRIPWIRWRTEDYGPYGPREGYYGATLRLMIPVSKKETVLKGIYWEPIKTWPVKKRKEDEADSRFVISSK